MKIAFFLNQIDTYFKFPSVQCRLSLHVHCMSLRRYRQFSREQPQVALIQIMLAIDVMVQFRTSEPAQSDQF